MALTPVQRKELLVRLIVKAQNGQIDGEKFVDELVTAVGTDLDATLTQERDVFRSDLAAAKAAADAQSAEIAAKLAATENRPTP